MKFDMHLHTTRHSPDSVMTPEELVGRAVEIGLDGVVITEHDYQWTEDELDGLRAKAPGLVILAGVEVTARGGDVLVYGATDPFALPRGIEWTALCREVHRQGGAAVIAHPYRWGQPVDKLLAEKKPEFDGIELVSNNMDRDVRKKAAALAERHPEFATIGNSDGHEWAVVGCCHTLFDVPVRTTAELVAAIRGRKCRGVAGAPGASSS